MTKQTAKSLDSVILKCESGNEDRFHVQVLDKLNCFNLVTQILDMVFFVGDDL